MTRFLTLFIVISALNVTTLFSASTGAQEAAGHASYQLKPGDVLMISVWKEEGLEREILIRPDGGLSFPLVGDVIARGKSVDELRAEIAAKLDRYIPDPVVTVTLVQLLGNKVYVIGQVNQPGQFLMTHDVDVMQALSMAGGTTPFAALNKIKILRRTGDESRAIPFRYGDVEAGKALEQNILLESGDVVVVP